MKNYAIQAINLNKAFKKKNTIVVDVYTDRTEMFEAYQPMLARKFIPDWWKNLPQHREADMP